MDAYTSVCQAESCFPCHSSLFVSRKPTPFPFGKALRRTVRMAFFSLHDALHIINTPKLFTPLSTFSSSSNKSPIQGFNHSNRQRFCRAGLRSRIPIRSNSFSDRHSSSSSPGLAVLLEVEGVLVDVYRYGNRQAFNVAFQRLGLDCASWTDPIYLDLARKAAGDEERMLVIFFDRIGWPTSLPTSEKETFLKSVLREKRKALDEYVMTKSLPLRPGAEDFIDDALSEGIPVVILTSYSKNGDKVCRSVIENLGAERIPKIKVVGKEEMEGSFYGQLVLGKGVSSSLDEQLAKEARKAASLEKRRIAEEVASMLKLSVDIDTGSTESLKTVIATLRAGAEYAGLPVHNCVLIAGNQTGALGAERVGMPCVVLRSSFTAGAEFPSAKAVMDGFGSGELTISKLRKKRWA